MRSVFFERKFLLVSVLESYYLLNLVVFSIIIKNKNKKLVKPEMAENRERYVEVFFKQFRY